MNDLISIILPTHNAEESIDRCIESILRQTYTNWELICCDDKSDDNTLYKLKEWEKKDKRIKVLWNDENKFAAYTRNKAFNIAHGNYIAQIDDDDYMDENRLQIQLDFLRNNQNYSFVGSAMYYFDEESVYYKSTVLEKPIKRDFLRGSTFSNPSTMFRKECLDKINYYRVAPETVRGQDYDMYMRLYAAGYIGYNLKTPLTYYYRGKKGYKKTNFKIRINEFKIRWVNFKNMGLFPIGILFCFKPIILVFIPFVICERIKKIIRTTKG